MEGISRYVNDIENLKATELRLGLPGTEEVPEKQSKMPISRGNKRAFSGDSNDCLSIRTNQSDVENAPATKVQIVGWPPIRSYRKNNFLQGRKVERESTGLYVKVSMDGAPYLRKIDIKVYKGYKELREALEDMFKCFSLVSELSACNESDYAITYEDKDGDLMLVGDVPWGMFINSCKRLRIMKGSEARGLGSS